MQSDSVRRYKHHGMTRILLTVRITCITVLYNLYDLNDPLFR